jgi:hypothetical protein
MKLTIKTSGGIGGIGLSPKPHVVDDEYHDPAIRKRVRTAVSPDQLKSLAQRAGNPHAADMITYEMSVTDGDTARVELGGDSLPAELLDLIDELKAKGD